MPLISRHYVFDVYDSTRAPLIAWQPRPQKTDLLLIAAHTAEATRLDKMAFHYQRYDLQEASTEHVRDYPQPLTALSLSACGRWTAAAMRGCVSLHYRQAHVDDLTIAGTGRDMAWVPDSEAAESQRLAVLSSEAVTVFSITKIASNTIFQMPVHNDGLTVAGLGWLRPDYLVAADGMRVVVIHMDSQTLAEHCLPSQALSLAVSQCGVAVGCENDKVYELTPKWT